MRRRRWRKASVEICENAKEAHRGTSKLANGDVMALRCGGHFEHYCFTLASVSALHFHMCETMYNAIKRAKTHSGLLKTGVKLIKNMNATIHLKMALYSRVFANWKYPISEYRILISCNGSRSLHLSSLIKPHVCMALNWMRAPELSDLEIGVSNVSSFE